MDIVILSVPYALGRARVGMGLGPERVLAAGLAASLEELGHRTAVDTVELEEPFGHEIGATFSLNRTLARKVAAAGASGAFPLVLAGNCNAAHGTLAGLDRPVGVVWLDAHGDFNTPETTVSGYLDGMALAIATGRCFRALAGSIAGFRVVDEANVVLAGARDLDAAEAELVAASPIVHLRPAEVDERSAPALSSLAASVRDVYLHIDLDVLDPSEGAANVYAAPGGLSLDAARRLIRDVAAHARVRAAGFASYDPSCDPEGRIAAAAVSLAGELARGLR